MNSFPFRPLQRLVAARSGDPDLARREFVINVAVIGLLLLGLLWVGAELLTSAWDGTLATHIQEKATSYLAVGAGLLICLLVYGLSRLGRVQIAGYVLIGVLLGYTTALLLVWGIEIADVVLFFLAIALAGLMAGGRGSLVTATLAVSIYAAVGLLQAGGAHRVALKWPLLPSLVSFAIVLYLVATLNWIANRHLTVALEEARRQTDELRAARQDQALLLADLQAQTEQQAHLLRTVEELSAPVIVIYDQIIVLPLIGHLDNHRADSIRQALLEGIAHHRARITLIDLTGLLGVNEETVVHLQAMIQAGRLLGSEIVLVGIHARAAAELAKARLDQQGLLTQRDLQSGIEWALARVDKQIVGLGRPMVKGTA